MDWMKSVTWQAALVVSVVLAAVVALVLWGNVALKDILGFVTGVLSAIVLAKAKQIEQNTNGTNQALREDLAAAQKTIAQLAARVPPNAPLPAALTDEAPAKGR